MNETDSYSGIVLISSELAYTSLLGNDCSLN